ncbi:hypothetical protein PLESTF_000613200 [Pleodorina starrii]|nr:hypothetical protein PLESTF_000613200 [Pleodorina starrii]
MSSPLLPPSCGSEEQLAYYKEVLLDAKASSIEVQLDVNGKGKGLVATRNINEGETVFVERPLVSLQHLDNHGSAVVCQACLRFVGSVELQIGHKLRCLVEQLRGAQHGAASGNQSGSGDSQEDEEGEVDLEGALEAGERLEQIYSHVTPERIADLCSGTVTLPLSDDFRRPPPVPCRRGCGALYCGAGCEAEAWEHSHCLLCAAASPPADAAPAPASTSAGPAEEPAAPGPSSSTTAADETSAAAAAAAGPSSSAVAATDPSAAAAPTDAGAGPSATAAAAGAGPSSSSAPPPPPAAAAATEEELYGIRVDRRALAAFWDHARETNEIFLLAAQVVAATLLRAAKLVATSSASAASEAAPSQQQQQQQQEDGATSTAAGPSSSSASASLPGPSGPSGAGGAHAGACRSALLAAWRPYKYGWKRCWWESVAVPDDVEDEGEFRAQLRSLASDSLELLSAAITDPRFGPDLLQLEVYGSIVGMFELNNMGLSVASPVEDFFLAVDEMDELDEQEGGAADNKLAVTKVTQPLLDALDAEYATPCEATAFLALQSCINHSCDPNCTAACDTGNRTVTVLAQRDIHAGEEITLSYIDVSLPYKDRQADLRDYGFVCRCQRCVADAAAARAKRQGGGARGGVRVGGRRR